MENKINFIPLSTEYNKDNESSIGTMLDDICDYQNTGSSWSRVIY